MSAVWAYRYVLPGVITPLFVMKMIYWDCFWGLWGRWEKF